MSNNNSKFWIDLFKLNYPDGHVPFEEICAAVRSTDFFEGTKIIQWAMVLQKQFTWDLVVNKLNCFEETVAELDNEAPNTIGG